MIFIWVNQDIKSLDESWLSYIFYLKATNILFNKIYFCLANIFFYVSNRKNIKLQSQ